MLIILLGIGWLSSCNSYIPFVSNLETGTENCKDLKNFVSNHWYSHKNKHLYRCKDQEQFVKEIYSNFKECFFDSSFDEIKFFFGEPNLEIPFDELHYHISKDCLQKYLPCELLVISFDNSTNKPVSIMFQ